MLINRRRFLSSSVFLGASLSLSQSHCSIYTDQSDIKAFGAKGDGVTDDTAAFKKACSLGRHIVVPHGNYKLTGEIPLATNTILEFQNNPAITMDCSGDYGRGFYFGEGVHDAKIIGSAKITAFSTAATTMRDGTRNGVFSWASDFYLTHTPLKIYNCDLIGNFDITIIGALNVKPVQIFGWVEDCKIGGVIAKGQCNYAFSCHWVGNGNEGILPTKTWHPHNIVFESCLAKNTTGNLRRAFTTSAVGKVTFNNCQAINPTLLGLNLFVGDYGYQYAQNITAEQAFNIEVNNSTLYLQGNATAVSADGLSSRLNNSNLWAGNDHNATIEFNNLNIIRKNETNLAIGLAGIKYVKANFNLVDSNPNNPKAAIYLTCIGSVNIAGNIKSNGAVRYRDCGKVESNLTYTPVEEKLDTVSFQQIFNGNSYNTTVTKAVNKGDTTMTLSNINGVVGAGGYIQYEDGTNSYEIEMLSTTFSGGQQTIKIAASPVFIPNGSQISVISVPCKQATIGGQMGGVRIPLVFNNSGSNVHARARNVVVTSKFYRSGINDIDAQAINGLTANISSDYCGIKNNKATSACINLGENAENWRIVNSRFGRNTNAQHIARSAMQQSGACSNNIIEVNSAKNGACVFN